MTKSSRLIPTWHTHHVVHKMQLQICRVRNLFWTFSIFLSHCLCSIVTAQLHCRCPCKIKGLHCPLIHCEGFLFAYNGHSICKYTLLQKGWELSIESQEVQSYSSSQTSEHLDCSFTTNFRCTNSRDCGFSAALN